MATGAWRVSSRATVAQRWLARLSLAAAAAAAVVLLAMAGAKSLALVAVGAGGLALTAAGVWWTLSRRGVLRLLALALVVGAPVAVLVLYVLAHLAWLVLLSLALWTVAVGAGRAALSRDTGPEPMPESEVSPPRRPFLIMNPRSGGGKVAKFGLEGKARALGAEVALLEGPGMVDVTEIARKAVANGADAAVVQSPAYRADKAQTTLNTLPELLAGQRGPRLRVRAGRTTIDGPQAVLVSNNTYGMGDVAGLGRRSRLDGGVLGVLGVTVGSALQAAGLLRGRHWRGLTVRSAREVIIEADASHIPVGVDGEALSLPTPVRCTVRPKALQVRVPRNRPGVPLPKPPMNWRLLGRMTLTR